MQPKFEISLKRLHLCLVLILCFASRVVAGIKTVGSTGEMFSSIQSAIDASSAGDIVLVSPGVYFENIDFAGKAVHLKSKNGPNATTIDGGGLGSVVSFVSGESYDSICEGFTLTNGNATRGGGVTCYSSSPTIVGNIFYGNSAEYGAGVACRYDSSPIIINNVFADNIAAVAGAALYTFWGDVPTFYNNTVYGNSAGYEGGAFAAMEWCYSSAVIKNSIFWNNASPTAGYGDSTYGICTFILSDSDLQGSGGYSAEPGVIDEPPEFYNAAVYDFRLSESSSCIDSGTNDQDPCSNGWFPTEFPACAISPTHVPPLDLPLYNEKLTQFFNIDIDGTSRPDGPANDMGAYEGIAGATAETPVLEIDKNPLSPGDTAKIRVTPPPGISLDWTIEPKAQPLGGTAKARISQGQTARISDVSGEGVLAVTVTSPDDPSFILQGSVEVGCGACQSCNAPGGGWFKLSSILGRFSLGKAKKGDKAGDIYLAAQAPAPENSTPQILELAAMGNAQGLYDSNGLRQVVAPEAFVDIVVADDFEYDINFYKKSAMGDLVDGFYEISGAANPYVVWKIENPDRSPTVYNRLLITEDRGLNPKVSEYAWDDVLGVWSLSKGNGLQVSTKGETIVGPDRIVREIVKDNAGVPSSDVETTYRMITGGGAAKEEEVERIEDPAGLALTTAIEYYEDPTCPAGSCGLVKSQINPDGSWVAYEYDALGRKTAEIAPWLDSPAGSPAGMARATYYEYDPVDPTDSQATEDSRLPRTVREEILGVVVSKTYQLYQSDANGRIEIVEQCFDSTAAFGDPWNLRTETAYYPEGSGLASDAKIASIVYPDGRMDSFFYEYGVYAPGVGAPGAFTPGAGTDVRETSTHGTTLNPQGVADKTTIEKRITDELGKTLLEETYVYTGAGEERIGWTVQVYDDLGRVETVYSSDGGIRENIWGCCSQDSTIDELGVTTNYIKDDLGRVETEERITVNGTITTTKSFDAQGRNLARTVIAGALVQFSSTQYDAAGRPWMETDSAGLVSTYDYQAGGRTTTLTVDGRIDIVHFHRIPSVGFHGFFRGCTELPS